MITIKVAQAKDATNLAEIYDEWTDFEGKIPAELIAPVTPDMITSAMKGSTVYLLALLDNLPAGVCYLDTSFVKLATIRLGDMIVKKKFRKVGVGSALVNGAISQARQLGATKIWLWTQPILTDAIKLYESLGFKREGVQNAQFCGQDALLYGRVI